MTAELAKLGDKWISLRGRPYASLRAGEHVVTATCSERGWSVFSSRDRYPTVAVKVGEAIELGQWLVERSGHLVPPSEDTWMLDPHPDRTSTIIEDGTAHFFTSYDGKPELMGHLALQPDGGIIIGWPKGAELSGC